MAWITYARKGRGDVGGRPRLAIMSGRALVPATDRVCHKLPDDVRGSKDSRTARSDRRRAHGA